MNLKKLDNFEMKQKISKFDIRIKCINVTNCKFIKFRFNIKVQLYESNFKVEVQKFIDQNSVKAIIMGNRRTDPYSQNLTEICPSSEGWPVFTRIFPILDWNYLNVWQFLKTYNL